jgi:U32 family peptidase
LIPKRIPELLVPANNLNVLKYAVQYGADAVYAGGKKFNLRSLRGNFTIGEIDRGIKYAHKRGVKVYLALNAIVHEDEVAELEEYIENLKGLELDGIIISDFGVMSLVRKILPDIRIHISTQSNITNLAGVKVAAGMGAYRVNLSREISYGSLKKICRESPIEIEVFVHGALCISYSGRCMLSKYMIGRDANKGECAHSCRWKYYLMEEKRPNLFFPVVQDNKGTYIYNSRDLCLLEELDSIISAGVDSIKIEGRMKTENYVSLVTWVYRMALDSIKNGNFDSDKKYYLKSALDGSSHRNFTKGFMFQKDKKELEDNENVGYVKKYEFTGTVKGEDRLYGEPLILVRNQFSIGQTLDILQPGKYPVKREIGDILLKPDYRPAATANPNDVVIIRGLKNISPFSILRIKK